MEGIIKQLENISKCSDERAQRNIKNLIGRIEFFEQSGDESKLNECLGEAGLWGAK